MSKILRHKYFFPAALICLTFLVYLNGFHNGFLSNWDDPLYIWENPDIQSFSFGNIKEIFSTFYVGNYAPIQMLSYMVDYWLWGKSSSGFFLTNLFLHALNAVLFYLLLLKLGLDRGWSFLVALLFAIVPVQVESVAWLSQRKNVLAMTFFLPAILAYLHAIRRPIPWNGFFLLSNVFFVFALLTKAVTVVLPAILLLFDIILREREWTIRNIALEKAPFVAAALVASALALVSQRPESGGGMVNELHGGSGLSTFLTMVTVVKDYIVNICWPTGLSAFYHVDIKENLDFEVILSLLLLTAVMLSLMATTGANRKYASFGLLVFFIGLLPVSQIIPINTLMNDRYLYFPMLGFSLYLVMLLKEASDRLQVGKRPLIAACSMLCLVLAIATWNRVAVWSDSVALWRDAAAKQSGSDHAWKMLGNSYGKEGKMPEAIAAYKSALELNSGNIDALYDLGVLYDDNEDYAKAIEMYYKVLAVSPGHVKTIYNLGLIYTLKKQFFVARNILNRGLLSTPDDRGLLLLVAANSYFLQDYDSASTLYEKVRALGDNPAEIAGLQSLVALRQGDDRKKILYWNEALDLGRQASEIYLDWARLDATRGDRDLAMVSIEKAILSGHKDLAAIYNDPDFENLRNDEAFRAMTKAETP